MARHELRPTPQTVHWGHFDAALPAVLAIDPGDEIVVDTVSGGAPETPPAGGYTVRPEARAIHAALKPDPGPHILTGPIYVRGAEPGDALRIEILDIALADDWGFNWIKPGKGALPEDFPFERIVHLGIDKKRRVVKLPWGLELPAKPFFGVMGTAPAGSEGRWTSVIPGAFGGNIDLKELTAGAVLTLPVFAPGALLSIGDGHGAQGDGEVCLTAVETGLTGTFRIHLIKDAGLDAPFAQTPTHAIAMAFDEDLDLAAKTALRRMIRHVVAVSGLSAEDAYRLCSLTGDLRVTQVVNVRKGVHMMMPLECLATQK